jgi:hypothetical protein
METLGAWQDHPAAVRSSRMVVDASQLAAYWRRCSLSSDFWARYAALGVPATAAPGRLRRDAVESVLSYLLNELFENCAKFSGGPLRTVNYECWLEEGQMVFQVRNHIEPAVRVRFTAFIQELLNSDPDELYFKRLEENVELNRGGSGLGYLTLMKDYGIRFGFRFQQVGPESVAVDVQAHVSMTED